MCPRSKLFPGPKDLKQYYEIRTRINQNGNWEARALNRNGLLVEIVWPLIGGEGQALRQLYRKLYKLENLKPRPLPGRTLEINGPRFPKAPPPPPPCEKP